MVAKCIFMLLKYKTVFVVVIVLIVGSQFYPFKDETPVISLLHLVVDQGYIFFLKMSYCYFIVPEPIIIKLCYVIA